MRLLLANRAQLIRATIYLSCTVFLPFSFATALKVDLPADQITLEYQSPVRLEQVLSDITQQDTETVPSRYPLANQLFNLDKQEQAEKIKQDALKELQVLATEGVLPKESAGIIREQINSWNIAYRELIELDLDQIRTHVPSNPMLQGHFEFVSPMRNQVLSFEGLLFSPQRVEFDSSTPLSSYLSKLKLLSSAHPSYAWVVYPNGDYVRAGYAYWNNQGTQLAPGTIVFVGFNSEAKAVLQLEERIVKLITMRRSTK
tara:strand:- start:28129 stop:28902 length:774 start_codon:yes stop_codon:yes gene_type:complete